MSTIIAHPAPEAHPDRDAAARKRADRLAKATTYAPVRAHGEAGWTGRLVPLRSATRKSTQHGCRPGRRRHSSAQVTGDLLGRRVARVTGSTPRRNGVLRGRRARHDVRICR
jgi:hypothetical protein